jgi:hypothetical protein
LSLVIGTRSIFGYGSSDEEFDYKRYRPARVSPCSRATAPSPGPSPTIGKARPRRLQLASGPWCPTNNSAGGATSVRGYLAAERTGDDGVLLSQELRTPSLAKYLGSWCRNGASTPLPKAQLYLRDPLPDQDASYAWPVSASAPAPA